MLAIETVALAHRYTSETVLRGLDLSVRMGAVYGFLGPNGAGKTTTLRLLLGLLRRQQGTIRINGLSLDRHRLEILRGIGSSIEVPSLYGHLTAAENLEVWRRIYRCSRTRIQDALSIVGLASTAAKRVERFSLGMKQRLAIAVALLHEPALLLLDEPTNGLDPEGIIEVRELLARLNRERGTTIVVSSHILSEVERLVTDVGIIHRGTLVFQGTLGALGALEHAASLTIVETSNNARALAVARQLSLDGHTDGTRLVLRALTREQAAALARALASEGLDLYQLRTQSKNLERIFLDMVGARA